VKRNVPSNWLKPQSRCLGILLAVLFLSCLLSSEVSAQTAGQEAPPPLPAAPPPAITYSAQTVPPVIGKANSISAVAGWQIISFPVRQVDSVWGLKRMLYKMSRNSYVPIDPVNNPQSLEPGLAYITYSDSPCKIYFTGNNQSSQPLTTSLQPGWNLVGLPSMKAVNNPAVTLTNMSGQTIVPTDLKERASWPQRTWISPQSNTFVNGRWTKTEKSLNSLVAPGQIFALYCREPLRLNWNINLPSQAFPEVTQVTPANPAVGDIVFVKGNRLGNKETGTVSVAGMALPNSCILDWQQNYIKFKMAQGIPSGSLRVSVNGKPSTANLVAISTSKTNLAKAAPSAVKAGATGKAVSTKPSANKTNISLKPATKSTNATPKTAPKTAVTKGSASKSTASASVKKLSSLDEQIANAEYDLNNIDLDKVGANSSKNSAPQAKAVKAVSPDDVALEVEQQKNNADYYEKRSQVQSKLRQAASDDDASYLLPGGSVLNGSATLVGEVVSYQGRPIKGARVALSSGQRGLTDQSGAFIIRNVPSDRLVRISVSKSGYKVGRGKIAINDGQTKRVKVELTKLPKDQTADGEEAVKTGNFTIRAESLRVGPRERRLYISKIEVTQDGNLSKHWQNTWWDDNGDNYTELRCDEANLDETYNITITWKSRGKRAREITGKWSKKFTSDDQTFTFSHP